MRKFKIKRQLGSQYCQFLIGSLLVLPLVLMLAWGLLREKGTPAPTAYALMVVVVLGLLLLYFGALGFCLWRLFHMDRHSDLVQLGRYGPLADLLPAIEAELADPKQVAKVGRTRRSFRMTTASDGDLAYNEVWFTPSWLIYNAAEANRMQFFRLDSLVLAARLSGAVLLADEQGARLEIPGTDAGVTRLLAELLMRIPWVLNHFDAEVDTKLQENRQQIVAAVELRRQQAQIRQRLS